MRPMPCHFQQRIQPWGLAKQHCPALGSQPWGPALGSGGRAKAKLFACPWSSLLGADMLEHVGSFKYFTCFSKKEKTNLRRIYLFVCEHEQLAVQHSH